MSWIQRLGQDFDRREARRRRTRNALVHGGSIAERSVETTAEFADALAVRALATSIEGRLVGRDLIDHLLDERGHFAAIEQRPGGHGHQDQQHAERPSAERRTGPGDPGIAVIGAEGAGGATLAAADVVVPSIETALGLLGDPLALAATLRP